MLNRVQLFSESVRQAAQDEVNGLFAGVGDSSKADFIRSEYALVHHEEQEVAHAFPEVATDQDQRKWSDFAALKQSGGLEQLVERAEAPGQDNVAAGVFDQHHLAHKEVIEFNVLVDVRIGLLLVGKNDIESVRRSAGFASAAVGRFHCARSAAGNDSQADFSESAAHMAS